MTDREFPNRPDLLEMIPLPEDITLSKLGDGGAVITDTCNTARKLRRILVDEKIEGTAYELDCFQHLRNIWINGAAKAVTKFLNEFLDDSLESISSFLRVSPDLANVIRAFHKEFSLDANYPKGHGEKFRSWMIKNYPMEFLMHAERATGSRQDLVTMGAGPVYWNRVYSAEFLDKALRRKGNDNILQQNLFIILSSVDMIAVSRFFSILHVAVCIPFRWLTGNTHKLAEHNWGARSMGRGVDIIYDACIDILDDITLIHDEAFMMHIFDDLRKELLDFDTYLTTEFTIRQSHYVKKSKTKAVPLKMLIKELFTPADPDNQSSSKMLEKVAAIGIQAILDELLDEKKATYKYLSISGTEFSYEHCPDAVKEKMLGKMASNDLAESSFAGLTAQIQCYGRIGMCNAAAVSDTSRNGFLSRPTTRKEINEQKRGLYHTIAQELQITLGMVCMEDSTAVRKRNDDLLERQRKFRQEKDDLVETEELDGAEDNYIDALIYHRMGRTDACWKTVGEVTEGLKRLKYKKDKIAALKDNIRIRWIGYGWEECETKWSKDRVQLSIAQLASRLKEIIKLQKKYKWEIPETPNAKVPQRKCMPVLGQLTKQTMEMDKEANENIEELEKQARAKWQERDEQGEMSMHSRMQEKNAPTLDDAFIGTRIEFLSEFDLTEDGTETDVCWCGGVIKEISDGTWIIPTVSGRGKKCYKKGEAADIYWEAVETAGFLAGRAIVELNPRKWNKEVVGGWRKDLGDINYSV